MKSFSINPDNSLIVTSAPNEKYHEELNGAILEAKKIDLGVQISDAYDSSINNPEDNIKEVLGLIFDNAGVSDKLELLIIRDPEIEGYLWKESLNGQHNPITISFPNGTKNEKFLSGITNPNITILLKGKEFQQKKEPVPSPVISKETKKENRLQRLLKVFTGKSHV
ncbi:MAG: hypothetical protein ACJAW3_001532 [Lentimonas sp.]|jgi:hypothetical protein